MICQLFPESNFGPYNGRRAGSLRGAKPQADIQRNHSPRPTMPGDIAEPLFVAGTSSDTCSGARAHLDVQRPPPLMDRLVRRTLANLSDVLAFSLHAAP